MTFDPNKSLKLTIDSSKVDNDLTDFPILVVLSSGTGITGYDATVVFDELNQVTLISGTDVLLLHMDDDELIDSSPSQHAVTKYGNVVKSSSESRFGGYSAYFDGSGDYLDIDNSVIIDMSSKPSTIDCWVYFSDLTLVTGDWGHPIFSKSCTSSSCEQFFGVNEDGSVMYYRHSALGTLSVQTAAGLITLNNWHHVALTVDGTYWRIFVDGVKSAEVASTTFWANPSSSSGCHIGRVYVSNYPQNASYFKGFMDEVSISVGVVRWASNFMPPNGPYGSSYVNRKKIAITTTVSGVEIQCPIEIESWDADNEQAYLWTKVPTIYSGSDTELIFYYDSTMTTNSGYVGDTGDVSAQNVWDSNFVGVWHMTEGIPVNDLLDSTNNSYAASSVNMDTIDSVDGKIAKAINFDGDAYYTLPTSAIVVGASPRTLEFLMDYEGPGDDEHVVIVMGTDYVLQDFGVSMLVNGSIRFFNWDSDNDYSYSGYFNDWHYIQYTYDGIQTHGFIDLINPINATKTLNTGTDCFRFGARSDSIRLFNGKLDEIRLSNIERSDTWRQVTYYSNFNNLITFTYFPISFNFSNNPIPTQSGISYGYRHLLGNVVTVSGECSSYVYDTIFYADSAQIGSTVSGTNSGSRVTSNDYLMTPVASGHSWYMVVTSSGYNATSPIYYFDNMFLCQGYTEVDGLRASGIYVRLYKRDDGSFIGEDISSGVSGTFQIPTDYTGYHYAIALHDSDIYRNSEIFDWIAPTIS